MYNEEFKKQLVKEYIQGKPFSAITAECGVAKSCLLYTSRSYWFFETFRYLLAAVPSLNRIRRRLSPEKREQEFCFRLARDVYKRQPL